MTDGPGEARRTRRHDTVVVVAALSVLVAGLVTQPIALRLDVGQRVADACFPWAAAGEHRLGRPDRTWGFLLAPPPPDPWGRPWRHRLFDPTVDTDRHVGTRLNPAAHRDRVQGGPLWVVYSVGPDGVDDGGVPGRDCLVEVVAVRRLVVTDVAAEAGAWLSGLLLLAWLVGRGGARRAWLQAGLIPLGLGAMVAAVRTVGGVSDRVQVSGELPGLPLVVTLQGAVILSLLALLGLVAAHGWATTRRVAQAEGDGAGAGEGSGAGG